jgi:hypothetical protein
VSLLALLLACSTPQEGLAEGDCDNGRDDDGDHNIDCEDAGCLDFAGCQEDPDTADPGVDMIDAFALDGERRWEFAADGAGYDLIATLEPAFEYWNTNVLVRTIAYERECDGTDGSCIDGLQRKIKWSNDPGYGVMMHGFIVESGSEVTFAVPLRLAYAQAVVGDVVENDIGGVTWTSTFETIEPCPIRWTDAWQTCARIRLDDGDGDPDAGSPVAGTWWFYSNYAHVAMRLTQDPGRWELTYASYQ